DRKFQELVGARNQADALVHSARTAIKDNGDKVPGDVIGRVESAIADVEAAMKGDDKAQIEARTKALEEAAQSLFAAAAAAQQPGADAGAGPAPGGDDVVDAEFTEVKDDEKKCRRRRVTGVRRAPCARPGVRSRAVARPPSARWASDPRFPISGSRPDETRLLRSPRCLPRRQRGRHQEGLSPLRDEVPPGPQPGRQGRRGRKYHPDGSRGDKAGEAAFRECKEAHEVLADGGKRRMYDQRGHAAFEHGMGGGGPGPGFGPDMGDIFGDIFGNIFGGGAGRGPRRGAGVGYVMGLGLEDADPGVEKRSELPSVAEC